MFAYCNFCENSKDSWKIDDESVRYFVSDKHGGSSRSPYEELNMGMNVGDCVDDVLYNRLLIARHSGLPLNRYVYASQVHGNNITTVSESDLSEDSYSVIKATDGLITRDKYIALIVLAADCVPVIIYDENIGAAGVFHAGWRGVANSIVPLGIEQMHKEFGSQIESLKVFIGPSIGACCYEVKGKVIDQIQSAVPNSDKVVLRKDGKTFINLKTGIEQQLLKLGLTNSQITTSSDCTKCKSDQYYSYRHSSETGRFCAGIYLT
ncbi:peptidoglycan editing factor PgeF [Carboxylicivirga sp. N1Y90]|uniref:peptidoglycan editing factor PgeF n=1 Tax=Carboxylicivirga fragile TaxID=3417571 RepID=UPI003D358442|nr:peptidoglycan editing factor PgeF [Marinilabiliaceae bacterium N1Y90]